MTKLPLNFFSLKIKKEGQKNKLQKFKKGEKSKKEG